MASDDEFGDCGFLQDIDLTSYTVGVSPNDTRQPLDASSHNDDEFGDCDFLLDIDLTACTAAVSPDASPNEWMRQVHLPTRMQR
jgi:hypothetical protein